MIRTGILMAFLLVSVMSHAQVWFDFGLKGGGNSTMLVNNNIFNDKLVVHEFSFGNAYGFRMGTNIGSFSEFTFEYGVQSINQRWRMNDDQGNKFWRDIDMGTRNIGLLYRLHKNGTYSEIGYEFSKVQSAMLENSGDTPNDLLYGSGNIQDLLNPNYQSLLFGFGLYVIGNGNLSVIMGFRAAYSLKDVISEAGGAGSPDAFPSEYANYDSYAETHPLTIGLSFEINYDIGYLVSPHCETRNAFILF